MPNYAIFVACTPKYKKHVNALLNSFEKRRLYRGCNLTVYVLHYNGINKEWLQAITEAFSFKVIPIKIKREDIKHPPGMNDIEFVKRSRFHYIVEYGIYYDVICLLDADMFMVSPDFMKLFDLVNGTTQLIGCNEKIKWTIGNNYQYESKPIFGIPQKLYNMTCSVPIIFNYGKWRRVFEYYLKIAYFGRQLKDDNWVGVGDIMSWNISVLKQNKQNDVIVFPMESMCQVHRTYMHPDKYVQVENDYWYTAGGDKIYSIQGRWNTNLDFVDSSMAWCEENMFEKLGRNDGGKILPKIRKGLEAIQQEWYNLNFCSKLILDEENIWKSFNRGVL